MSHAELAAYVQSALQREGITVILSGGSAVSFYNSNKYVSKDLDLINTGFARRSKITSVMEKIGFDKKDSTLSVLKHSSSLSFPTGRCLLEKNR